MGKLADLLRARLPAANENAPAPKVPEGPPARDVSAWDVWAFDTETHRIEPGNLAPKMVCASVADHTRGSEALLGRHGGLLWLEDALRSGCHIVGANLAFDLGVVLKADPSLRPLVYGALKAGRLHDIAIREALIDIAKGNLFVDAKTGRPLDEDDDGLRYSLATLVERYFQKDISASKGPDAWRLRYGELDGIPLERWPQEAIDYPKADARLTVDVFWAQEAEAARTINGGNLHDEPYQMRAAWALHRMSLRGLRTNKPRVQALEQKVDADLQELQSLRVAEGFVRLEKADAEDVEKGKVVAYVPRQVRVKKADVEGGAEYSFTRTATNGVVSYWREDSSDPVPMKYVRDTEAIQARVVTAYKSLGYPAPLTKDGVSIDRDTLVQSKDPVLMKMGRGNRVEKYKSTYLPKLKAAMDGTPLNPKFNVLVATGRCSGDFQQLPQKGGIRECFEASPGYVFIQADYPGLELRTMSQRALIVLGYSRMAEVLKKKLDPHAMAASSFMGLPYEEVYRRYKAKDAAADGFRQLGKVFNFGKGGGLGAKGLVYNARAKDDVSFCLNAGVAQVCGVRKVPAKVKGQEKMVCAECVDVATELDFKWYEAWEEQKELKVIAGRLTDGKRRVTMEVWSSKRVRGNCGYTQWLNGPFQGAGGDIAKEAAWLIDWECAMDESSPLYGSYPVLQVHDEEICEAPADRAPEAAERMAFLMQEPAKRILPDLWETLEVEPTLATTISKKVETLRGSDGRLLVWSPS